MKRRCPACHLPVDRTRNDNIAGHFDKSGKPCVATGEPYDIALRVVVAS